MGKASRRKELSPQVEPLFIQQPMGQSIQKVEQSVQIRSGPLPDPEAIAAYERALPGAADRIFRMAEREQEHRHQTDLRESQRRHATIVLGQMFAFTLGIFGVCGGIWRGDSKVSVTRDGDTLTQKSCDPVYSPFGIEGSTRADPVVPPSFRFLGFFFLAQGRCVRQASRPRRIASMALSSRSTCTASAKGLSRALSLCSSAFFPALTCALACTRSYGVCGSS